MSNVSKTARASAGKQAPKEKVVLTPEKAIQEIRNLRTGKLAVLNAEYIDLLLGEYDKRGNDLALAAAIDTAREELKAQATKLAQALTTEQANHKDTLAELTVILDNRTKQEQHIREMNFVVTELFPEPFEGHTPVQAATRALRIMKENDDTNAVAIKTLMETVKRLEGQLAKLGVVVNPNPDIPNF